jgi:DNA-binding GntR family transcriptional regulator
MVRVEVEKIGKSRDSIPDEVLKKIFPKKIKRSLASELVYTQLKKMILSGKLNKAQKLIKEEIAQDFNVNRVTVAIAFSELKKDGLVIVKAGVRSFVA